MRKLLALLVGLLGLTVAMSGVGQASPAKQAAPSAAQLACGKTRTIGVAAPITGPAASIGTQQLKWAQHFVARYNRSHKRTKFRIISGDTQLPDAAAALQVAERFASNAQILGVVGPAGSQEVVISSAPFKSAQLGYVSGSATRTSLTTDGVRRGRFFRVVPNDDQQGPRVANYIRNVVRASRVVVIDGQDTYSQGLSDKVVELLRAANLTVSRESVNPDTTSDFSSLIARIPANTDVVYFPWQLAPKAQLFGTQLRAAGKNATLFGSDGLFDPDTFKIPGSLVSFFPVSLAGPVVAAYRSGPGGGSTHAFGLPTYVATDVVTRAIDKACKNGSATRLEVRNLINRTDIPKSQSLLGFRVRFVQKLDFPLGRGDMQRPADFGIYRINNQGAYVRVS